MSDIPKLAFTVDETAFALGVSASTVRKIVRDDPTFPYVRIGKRILINRDALAKWWDEKLSGGSTPDEVIAV